MKHLARLANIGLAGGSFVCLAAFGYLLWRHGFAPQYLSLLGSSVCLIFGMCLSEPRRVNLLLCLLSSVIALYSAEILLAYSPSVLNHSSATAWLEFPQDANVRVAAERVEREKQTNKNFDVRSRLQVVYGLRAQGIKAYPDVFPAVLFQPGPGASIRSIFKDDDGELLPLSGLANATTVFCNESGEYVVYESDEHGFHNPADIWRIGSADIVALGDSYAHGVCVSSEHSFAGVIRARYPATVNLGINGAGPLAMLATLKEYGLPLRPKIVLWFYYEGNDLRDLDTREKNSPLLMKYLTPSFSQRLWQRQHEIDQVLKDYLETEMLKVGPVISFESILKVQHLRRALYDLYSRRSSEQGLPAELIDHFTLMGAPSESSDLRLLQRILAEAQKSVTSLGGKIVFVYLPTWERYRIPELASKDRNKVLAMVSDLGMTIVDLHLAMSAHADPLSLFPFRRYAHYNEEGHKLVGEEVVGRLEQLKFADEANAHMGMTQKSSSLDRQGSSKGFKLSQRIPF